MQADGKAWLYVPNGLLDGPLPTHYEPDESPVSNRIYPGVGASPARQQFDQPLNRDNSPDDYPHILTTYRLTEHHTAGGMSRTLSYLTELQPELFCEIDPVLAEAQGLRTGDWATISTERAAIEARVLVTSRLQPIELAARRLHQVGIPYHWGSRGLTTGGSANDLTKVALDPNVHIQSVKALTCRIRPGRLNGAG